MKEPEDKCIYKRLFLDYTYGLGKIYSKEEVAKAKQSPSFEREYNLKYLGFSSLSSSVFHLFLPLSLSSRYLDGSCNSNYILCKCEEFSSYNRYIHGKLELMEQHTHAHLCTNK